MQIGRVKITADRWPWHISHPCVLDPRKAAKYGWLPRGGMGRFGGGWEWKLGIDASTTCIILNLLVGAIRISWYKPKGRSL